MNRKTLIAFALNASAPLSLEALHSSFKDSMISALLILPLGISLYLYVSRSWPKVGLYDAVRSTKVGKIQLYSWALSYFLYLSYTLDYAVFYDLAPASFYSFLLFFGLTAMTLLLLLGRGETLLIPMAVLQVVPMFLGWSPSVTGAQDSLNFVNILNSSLLLVCVTLIPYADGEPKMAWVIPASISVGFVALIAGSFLITGLNGIYQGISMIGLVMVEAIALSRTSKSLGVQPKALGIAFLVSAVLSLISPLGYYNITIAPSVALLYLSLFLAFLFLLPGIKRIVSLIPALMMIYGLYDSILIGDMLQRVVIGSALAGVILLGLFSGRFTESRGNSKSTPLPDK
ncbi:hypothetical protein [Metallosphaera hakonensis]|uniref:Uncharacterized protein n=1 Tax=Metallosphaera hakonensis JCM 8857 = DSM 7519 TaxID=1293036 RepID=A0A2U9IT00_9CREN|nr:hypothetical protein [Metallosphaera hakonensis]AWR99082.1 hypothetical protein DFR87_04550 [Metallosphaera hakonensis JCM 8857 = DSM 7519]